MTTYNTYCFTCIAHRALATISCVAVFLFGACAAPPSQESQDEPTSTSTSTSNKQLTLQDPIHHRLGLAREPMLVEHQNGTLFVSGYGSQSAELSRPQQVPNLWKSADQGQSWQPVDVGSAEDGAIGNSDVDLAVGPHGAVYFVSMGFDRTTFRGTHIAIGTSLDVGETWHWTALSETEFDDRPWVVVTPNATVHVVWNDGSGVAYARSEDHGATWQEQERIHPAGGSSHFAAGPNGELAVRISPTSASANRFDEGVDLIKVSLDNGTSWQERPLPGNPTWAATPEDFTALPRWSEPLAWDASGALFHLWAEGSELLLARSTDQGATWQRWTIARHDDRIFFPYLSSKPGSTGQLAATWFAGRDATLTATIARINVPNGGEPDLIISAPLSLEIFNQTQRDGQQVEVRDTAGEYFPVAFLASGALGIVTTIQPVNGAAGFSWWTTKVSE